MAIPSATDAVSERIGFRSIEVDGDRILLNGEPIFLRGVSIHEEAPMRAGRAWSREDARTLLGWEPKVGLEEGLKQTLEYFRSKI